VRLQDAAGQPVIDFHRGREAGFFEGLRSGEGIYILPKPRRRPLGWRKSMDPDDRRLVDGGAAQRPARSAALTLTNTEATPDNFQVFLKARNCDPPRSQASRPRYGGWERGELLLMSAGGPKTWRFQADDNAQWAPRAPTASTPLILVRQ